MVQLRGAQTRYNYFRKLQRTQMFFNKIHERTKELVFLVFFVDNNIIRKFDVIGASTTLTILI